MRKHLLPSALILAFGLSVGIAQNITKSVQLSQDPSGPIGFDTNSNVYFPAHQLTTGPGTPVLSACGTGGVVTGTDTEGFVAGETGAGGCVITFSKAYLATPYCMVASENPGTTPIAYSASTTAITISGTNVGAAVIHWRCSGSK